MTISSAPFQNYLRATVKVSMDVWGIEMVERKEKSAFFPREDT